VPARIAKPQDIPALVRLINAAYLVESFFIRGARTSEQEVRDLMQVPGTAFLVFDTINGSAPAGTVYVMAKGRSGHFALLAVDPLEQGNGLGRKLIGAVEEYCRTARCEFLELEVFDAREELPAFYESCGFRPDGTVPFSKPELLLKPAQLIVMRKHIGPTSG
jgi:GNAT superfamily N-acetyltransferase